MDHLTTVLGLDVHKETIVATVLPGGAAESGETITLPNTPQALTRLVRRAEQGGPVAAVYEAGPCGFAVYRHLTSLGVPCTVIAPSLTPVRPGDRVKTDRRDATKLARLFRAGELAAIHVPTGEEEALRDLVRTREDALVDRLRVRQQLGMFLLRQGRVFRDARTWGVKHREWLAAQHFDAPGHNATFSAYHRAHAEAEGRLEDLTRLAQDVAEHPRFRQLVTALRALKGIDTLGAVTLAVEVQDFHRFPSAPTFMAYTGLVVREFSSGQRTVRGSLTKSGNAHVRRILIEAAWCNRRGRTTHGPLLERRRQAPEAATRIARKAEARLHRKYWKLVGRNRPSQVAAVAVARELAGFVWAIARAIAPVNG